MTIVLPSARGQGQKSINLGLQNVNNDWPEAESDLETRRTVGIDFIDHVLELGFGGILSERPHNGAQLLCGDGSISVLVEERERLLELGDLFLCQLVRLKRRKHRQKPSSGYKGQIRRVKGTLPNDPGVLTVPRGWRTAEKGRSPFWPRVAAKAAVLKNEGP
jgi:hypothetical protein